MKTERMSPKELQKTLAVAGVAFLLLVSATYLSYRHTKSRTPQIVLPAGGTYLGPTPSLEKPASTAGKIPVPADAAWGTWTGKKFPYSFSYPTTLSLGFFPDDLFDAVTIFWNNTNPQENLLLRVEKPTAKEKNTRLYVENWWRQYAFTGVSTIEEFTTKQNLKGYRVGYKDSSGKIPYEHAFLEVPGKPELVIWMSQKLLDQSIFNRIVDSLIWGK